jgi:hypothetical protein
MQTLQEVSVQNQAVHPRDNSVEIDPARKVGVEIVRSLPDSRDWFEKATGKPRPSADTPDLPLFAAVRQ